MGISCARERHGGHRPFERRMQAFANILKLETDDPELTRAQFRSFSSQMPLLYAILVCNALAIGFSFFDPGNPFKTILTPLFICAVAVWRGVWWWQQRSVGTHSDAYIAACLRRSAQPSSSVSPITANDTTMVTVPSA
mgnify:CR=1 FL=1